MAVAMTKSLNELLLGAHCRPNVHRATAICFPELSSLRSADELKDTKACGSGNDENPRMGF